IALGGTGSNLLALGFGYWLIGAVVGSAAVGASNTLALAGTTGATVTVNYDPLTLTNFTDVLFGSGGNNRLAVGYVDFTLPLVISGFTLSSDVIDLQQIGTDGTISNFDTVSDEITVTGSGGSVTLRFDSIDGLTFATQSDFGTGINLAPVCYCRGTMILTDRGEVAVEELAIGDLVMTILGEAKPVKWVGYRAYDGRFVAGNRAMLPVRIRAGALADGVPVRDLLVSPGHALLIGGMLVRAEHLVNGATIVQETSVKRLDYFHIELETHDILIADGAPAESYIDCDNRGKFHNAADFARLYPDDERPRWQYCRPLLEWDSPEPDAIRAALLGRAQGLGHRLDRDPDLHLVVDGAEIRPTAVEDRLYRFLVPAGSACVSLVSRSVAPAEVEAHERDRRRLGVPVERLVLADGDLRIEAGHGHEGLAAGFHDDEATHRWTDGLASLPETWLRSFPGAFTLEVRLLPSSLPYRLPTPARTRAAA
ncbi:MAG TPA: Hint domain-containing protein, partial [Stellaceae bacterium]|nr:Hint domain-containing protein [Stellaceae bacterium]